MKKDYCYSCDETGMCSDSLPNGEITEVPCTAEIHELRKLRLENEQLKAELARLEEKYNRACPDSFEAERKLAATEALLAELKADRREWIKSEQAAWRCASIAQAERDEARRLAEKWRDGCFIAEDREDQLNGLQRMRYVPELPWEK